MPRWLQRLFVLLGLRRRPGDGGWHDPFARRPAPLKPRPKTRSGAVALAEPDE